MPDGSFASRVALGPEIVAAREAVRLAPTAAFLWVIDPAAPMPPRAEDLHLLAINDAYVRDTGVEEKAFVGHSLAQIMPPRGAETLLARYARAFEDGTHAYEEALDVSTGLRWWSTKLRALHDASGACVGILGLASDVTEARQQAESAATEITRLRRLAEEVRIFASMAAHDVRGPLGTVESITEVVLENFKDLGDGKAQLLRHANTVCRTARDQMDDLLRHSAALEADADARSEVDLGGMCRDVAALLDPDGGVRVDYPEVRVVCDRVVMHLVLRNLISNALRFAGSRVRIDYEPRAEGGRAAITVADDGPGFAAGSDPFGVGWKTRAETAHGFGLPAVRYIVETRGGAVRIVDSPLGGGAVRFTFPEGA